MSNQIIFDQVKAVITKQLGVASEKIELTSRFGDDLGADSLDIVELVMAFEEEFGCSIPDEDAEKLLDVKAAVDYIEAHKAS